jgi:hypothetical protein
MPSKLGLDGERLVDIAVVHHQIDVEIGRHVGFDDAQGLQELHAAMASVHLTDDFAGGDVKRGKQRRDAVARLVVRASFGDARSQRQQRLRAVERLSLALLVHAQRYGLERRGEVQPQDVTHLFCKRRIARKLEGLLAVWLQARGAPDARDGRLR